MQALQDNSSEKAECHTLMMVHKLPSNWNRQKKFRAFIDVIPKWNVEHNWLYSHNLGTKLRQNYDYNCCIVTMVVILRRTEKFIQKFSTFWPCASQGRHLPISTPPPKYTVCQPCGKLTIDHISTQNYFNTYLSTLI